MAILKNLSASRWSRRLFLGGTVVATGSLVVGAVGYKHRRRWTTAAGPNDPPEVNAWVVVQADETVIVRIARSEMGQGSLTGLAQLVAEELDCDWSRVRTEYPTPSRNLARSRVWGSMWTVGSGSIRGSHDELRQAGAAARAMLVEAAARGWKVAASECRTRRGVITHAPSGRRTSYGAVAAAAAKGSAPWRKLPLRDPKDWQLAGQRLARLDTAEKTTGALVYASDLQLPGLLNAAIRACPVFGGSVKHVDEAAVLQRPGVKQVVRVGTQAVAVVADTWWQAKTALDALPIEWDEGPNAALSSADIAATLKAGLAAPDAAVGRSNGDARAALAHAARRIEADYAFPYQHHATMEPMTATARFTPATATTPARCEAWSPSQNADDALRNLADAAGLPVEQCELHKLPLGGGFGRRAAHDFVRQAATLAKAVPGSPVKLIWSREEDMTHGYYHPVTQARLTAGLDAQGELQSLHLRLSGQSIIGSHWPRSLKDGRDGLMFQGLDADSSDAALGYTIAHLLIDHAMHNPPVTPGIWRGVNLNQNTFYLECFIDEIAHATQQDPLALRRKLMARHPKHLAVLEAAAERAGWGRPAAPGVFRGMAQVMGFGSYVAAVAEVSVDDAGRLRIHRIVAATDCGHAVNPQQIEAQVEGSFAFGLSAALYGECTVERGRIVQTNFDRYPVMQMAAMPRVETIAMPSGGFWGGVGEPTIAVAAPAVLNAVFAATGRRIRELPLRRHDLKRA